MTRPVDKHIDSRELEALLPSSPEREPGPHGLSPDAIREARHHLELCPECSLKAARYSQFVKQCLRRVPPDPAPAGPDCPRDDDVDWPEVAAGLWPQLKAAQLIAHAACCDHCGPRLRAAAPAGDDPTPQEEMLLSELKAPVRPEMFPLRSVLVPSSQRVMRWLIPVVALVVMVGVASQPRPSSAAPLSGQKFAEFAVRTHKAHSEGRLALDVQSDSQQTVNQWFHEKSDFALTLPASPPAPGENRPYRLEGARFVQVASRKAAFIAYQVQPAQSQSGSVSLVVAPESVAVASGGVAVDFAKVSFHYRTIEGYKVVTWSAHQLTYALVSEEGNSTQQSCMVCHSAMRDRDLTNTPTPLRSGIEGRDMVAQWQHVKPFALAQSPGASTGHAAGYNRQSMDRPQTILAHRG